MTEGLSDRFRAGSSATGTGSNAWIEFDTSFSNPPISVVCNGVETQNDWIFAPAGSWTAGSFYVETQTASQTFSWIAVGEE